MPVKVQPMLGSLVGLDKQGGSHMCWGPWGLNSHDFHIGDGHQPNGRSLYTNYMDSLLKVGWPSPIFQYKEFRPWHTIFFWGFVRNLNIDGTNQISGCLWHWVNCLLMGFFRVSRGAIIRRTCVHFQHDQSKTTEAVLFSQFCMEQYQRFGYHLKEVPQHQIRTDWWALEKRCWRWINAGGNFSNRNTVV